MRGKKELLILGLLFIMNFFSWSFLFYLNEETKVVFFDVGQGDAIFIRTAENHHILIDGGPGSVVLQKLEEEIPFFYREIDLIILTHAHYDHVSGILEVVEHYNVKNIMCTGAVGDSEISKKWKEVINEKGYKQARSGARVSGSNFYIDILYPSQDLAGEYVNDLNTVSVVSRLVFDDDYAFLFTGDAYIEQENRILQFQEECLQKEDKEREFWCRAFSSLDSDVLDVGHHGSDTSTGEEFLFAVSPSVGVIMVGEANRYGHPHQEVLERLKRNNVKIKRTDRDGDVIFNIN